MRGLILSLGILVSLSPGPRAAWAEIATIDTVPAATLLLPYFEIDLNSANGATTLFSINNASASAAVAHVTLWTDLQIPTFNFDVYLTGYDVQTINLRDVFNGVLPVTADDAADSTDTLSRQGVLSQDLNFPGNSGPCNTAGTLYNAPDPTLATKVAHMRAAHTGEPSPVFGGKCSGLPIFGDNVARGYVTVDAVTRCNLNFPSDAGYFGGTAGSSNTLWGDFFHVNSAENSAQGDSLVHIEACNGGNYDRFSGGGSSCPFAAGDYTFYGRYVGAAATDGREPLPTTFATRFVTGGGFDGGTDLIVWRDTKATESGINGPFSCDNAILGWFPLTTSDVVVFDEQENPVDLCVSPGGGCFALALGNLRLPVAVLEPPFPFGWIYANLNHVSIGTDPFPGVGQAWLSTSMAASGRFNVGFRAIALDNASAASPGGVVLLP